MANKVKYNNTIYDILDAITLVNRDYLLLVEINNMSNITFLESITVDGERKYCLPPKNLEMNENYKGDLKRLQANFIVQKVVEILIYEVSNGCLTNVRDVKQRFAEIRNFIYNDHLIKTIIDDQQELTGDIFIRNTQYIQKYFEDQLANVVNNENSQQYTYLDRPLKNSNGLDYEWLYDLSLSELKELASDKKRTSEDLIYIMDALDKRSKSDWAINEYTKNGNVFILKKKNDSAFIDIVLLSLITISFGLLLLLNIF